MALHVLTFKLTDGTTQTSTVPAGSNPDAWIRHIITEKGFWTDRNLQGQGGLTVASIFVNWEQVVSVTYTS
jgi:hypothetical protein